MKLAHVAIAVPSIDEALKFYRDTLGMELTGIEEVAGEKVRIAMLSLGTTRIELLEPMAADSPISGFLAKRGGGIHHIAFEVSGLDERVRTLEAAGVRILPRKEGAGARGHRYAFLHPSSCGGVLLELVEPPPKAQP